MTVYDLNRDQLIELKQHMITEENDRRGEGTSYGELADADNIISDQEVFAEFGGTVFSPDDFFSSMGEEEKHSGLSAEIGEAIQILADLHRYQVIFSNPGLSSTEAKVKKGVQVALRELNKAYQAALELRY